MSQSKLLLIFTLLAGIGIGAWARDAIHSDPKTSAYDPNQSAFEPGSDSSSLAGADALALIDELRAELKRAEQERDELRSELEALSVRLSALDEQTVSEAPDRLNAQTQSSRSDRRRRSAAGLTLEALTNAGLSERDAGAIKSRLDALSMQRLYLRDQAQREGWLGKQEYRDEIRRLNDAQNNLEREFGSENYARYLYATGRPNQVSVQSVIENSPAYNAGMQSGDRVISYDGRSVYEPRTIRRGTQQGTSGEMVQVVVMRDGQQIELYVPRGPLGIQMTADSVRPPDPQ